MYYKQSLLKFSAEIKKTHHESIFRKVYPIMMDIVEENRSNDVDKNVIHRKIAIFIIIFTGLGNPAHQLNVKDTQGIVSLHVYIVQLGFNSESF